MRLDPRSLRPLPGPKLEIFNGVTAWASAARAGDRLLVLTGRSFAEPERLVVADTRGGVRAVDVQAPHASDFVVDPAGAARTSPPGPPPPRSISTTSASSTALRERTSLLRRALAWLVPAAQAKEVHREMRRTLWVGDGLIASFGSDVTTDGRRFTSVPVGLRLIDTRTWTVRMVDEQVGFALLAGDLLLAVGAKEIGLVAYELNDTKRFQLFRGRSLAPFESYQGKAWIEVGRPAPQVVDVRTGRVIGPRRAPLPTLLVER